MFLRQEPDQAAIAEAAEWLKQQLPYLDGLLQKNEFLCGDEFTLADIIPFAYCQVQEKTSLDLSGYEHIMRWYGTISERPSVTKVNEMIALPI